MDGYVTIGTELDTKSFDAQIKYVKSQLDEIEYKIKQADMGFEVGDVQKLEAEYERLSQKLGNLVKKKEQFNKTDFSGIKKSIDNVGGSVEKVTKKVGRWALAVFGIRSAYLFVRQAMSTLSQYDDQMASNIEWIRYLLASALKPIIETIINLAYKLLTYLNYISQAWFGINLFANASTKAFEKQHKAVDKTSKKAKELQKTLTGFDEMNILQENGDVGSGGSKNDFVMPNFPDMDSIKIPKWLQWIVDNKDLILSVFAGIVAGIIAIKLGATALMGLGIGLAIAGIVYAIQKLIDFIKDRSFKNFIGILEGIAVAVLGVAIAIGAWPVAVGAAVAFVIVEIVKHFDEIMGLFDKLIKWIDTDFLGGLRKLFGPLGDIIYIPIKTAIEFGKAIFESFFGGIKKIVEGIVKIFNGDFLGGIKTIFGGLLSVMTAPLQGFLKAVKTIIPTILNLFKEIGVKVGQVIASAFKGVVNGVLGAIEKILNTPINTINSLIKTINKVPGINLGKLNTFKLPRLAKGGIINMPGNGVPVGGALAGERGQEGVIPLTDSQQMALLGEAIGRYITINANITNTMNGRVISRELQRVQNESNFAYNR